MLRPTAAAAVAALVLLLSVPTAPAAREAAAAAADYSDHTVHVVMSNHLDVGFTDLDSNVVDLYFHQHYAKALRLAEEVARHPNNTHGDTFKYLSHSWLLSLFFDCPPGMGWRCPNATEVAAVEAGIRAGTITWHAMPFNPQYEVFDASLLGFAVDLTHSLDARFGLPPKRMASLRDVPGLTRTAVPLLRSKGVSGLTAGVNGFSAPPAVPHTTPFLWLDEQTGQQLLAMWHPGGYAGLRADGLHIDSHHDCIRAPGLKHVLCCSWGDDNRGPPASADEVLAMFDHVRQQWPGARVAASTLEDYLSAVEAEVAAGGVSLPVFTGEIGDTWVHGIASDPGRMADYRTVLRARAACEAAGPAACDASSPAYFNFSRLLAKTAEHTWGISFNQFFGDFSDYTNAWLHRHLAEGEGAHPGLRLAVESWRRQRQYIDWALQALPPSHPIVSAVTGDRAARREAASVDPDALVAAGAVPQLEQQQQHAGPAGAAAAKPAAQPPAGSGGGGAGVQDHCAALLAASAAGPDTSSSSSSKDLLMFCSKHFVIQLDSRTGGITRLQRIYSTAAGNRDESQLGVDWAGGASACDPQEADEEDEEGEEACCQPDRRQQQEQHQAAAAAGGGQQPASPWQLVAQLGGALSSGAAAWQQWLPSSEAAAAAADFAVGDEAAAVAAAAAAKHAPPQPPAVAAAPAAGMQSGREQQGAAEQGAAAAAASSQAGGATAVYRRLLAVRDSLAGWRASSDAGSAGALSAPAPAPQQQQQHGPDTGAQPAGGSSRPATSDSSTSSSIGQTRGRRRRCTAPAFGQLQYDVYSLQPDYDFVWQNYAYQYPVWEGDFGKWNMSASSNLSATALPRLEQVYDASSSEQDLLLYLMLGFPSHLVAHAGAPARAWVVLASPPTSPALQLTLVWQNKTATRLPEALWLRFRPGRAAEVDRRSWLIHKLGGAISPSEIVRNGSHSLHAVSAGATVRSACGREQLTLRTLDVPLLNLGAPNPFPNPCCGPDMRQGVSFNPLNTIWGTNYAMWHPYNGSAGDNLAFRFEVEAARLPSTTTGVQG